MIKQYGMNLIIELPKQSQGEPADRRLAHFKRVQKFASVANKVYVLAPRSSPHWAHLKTFKDEYSYTETTHHWCSLGAVDCGTGQPLGHVTQIWSNDAGLKSSLCSCDMKPSPHIYQLRVEKTPEEMVRCGCTLKQKAYSFWATRLTQLIGADTWRATLCAKR